MKMKVYILPEVHAQIMYYVNKSPVEISGLGRIEKASDGSLVVTKAYLIEQENGAVTTDINEDAVAKMMFETREDKGDLNFWWHSHVDMNAFWSGTDMSTIEDFGKKGYLLATVFNKKGEHRTAYFQGTNGFLPQMFIDNISTTFGHLPTQTQLTAWEEDYKTKCKAKTYTSTWTSGGKPVGGIGSGWDEWDANHPSAFKDKEFWEGKSERNKSTIADTKAPIGFNTGMSLEQMSEAIKSMYKKKDPVPYSKLEWEDQFLLVDLAEIMYIEVSDEAMEEIYENIISSFSTMQEVIYDLYELAAYDPDMRKTAIDAKDNREGKPTQLELPVGKVITSRKGKQKLINQPKVVPMGNPSKETASAVGNKK